MKKQNFSLFCQFVPLYKHLRIIPNWIALFLLSFSCSVQAYKIEILYLNDYQLDQQLMVDGFIQFRLPDTIQEALKHEIQLSFETEIELIDRERYFGIPYSHSVKHITFETTLQFSNYNKTYYITNRRNNQVQAFANLNDALNTLGTISNFEILPFSELYRENNYFIRLRTHLNRWQLPTPLILDSLLDSDWDIDSDWEVIAIQGKPE